MLGACTVVGKSPRSGEVHADVRLVSSIGLGANVHWGHLPEIGSLDDYITCTTKLCDTHGCMGHWCRAPSGVVLPPRGACVFAPEPNVMAKSVMAAYKQDDGPDDGDGAHQEVKRSLIGKHGLFRAGCSSFRVTGSMRGIAVPAPGLPLGWVAVPEAAYSKMKMISLAPDGSAFREYRGSDTRYALVVRPPSIYRGSTALVRVLQWRADCVGLPLDMCVWNNADFDGDEIQVYPIASPAAIRECQAWPHPESTKLHELAGTELDWNYTWMYGTTRPLDSGAPATPPEMAVGMRHDSYESMLRLIQNPPSTEEYYAASVAGAADVTAQQIYLGEAGYRSRVAKAVASEIVCTGNRLAWGTNSIPLDKRAERGLPGYTGTAAIMCRFTQGLLNAHKFGLSFAGFRVVPALFSPDADVLHVSLVRANRREHMGGHVKQVVYDSELVQEGYALVVHDAEWVAHPGTAVASTLDRIIVAAGTQALSVAVSGVRLACQCDHVRLSEAESTSVGWVKYEMATRGIVGGSEPRGAWNSPAGLLVRLQCTHYTRCVQQSRPTGALQVTTLGPAGAVGNYTCMPSIADP